MFIGRLHEALRSMPRLVVLMVFSTVAVFFAFVVVLGLDVVVSLPVGVWAVIWVAVYIPSLIAFGLVWEKLPWGKLP